jgi:serine/threonine protein kinase
MAEIFRAKTFDSNGHAHLVAVKRVLAHLAEDDDFIQMLIDEAKIASMVQHPNIARVFEFARAHGEYFIAMEHVDGKDLRSIMERCRQGKQAMPATFAAYVTAEAASALHAAHVALDRRGRPLKIVHRDVSPSNIICSYIGEVKLCDFGIAKATLSRVQTKTGVIKGKVKYMSPEQALGRKLDHRSDLFSLGACFYEMLTRVPPFVATNEMDLLIKVRDAKYRPVREMAPHVPRELEAICDRSLTRSRTHRYQSGEEFAADLRNVVRHYAPGFSRSHLGHYVRKMFNAEIEDDLRLMEEYVVENENVDDDLGENLIAEALGPRPEFAQFSPRRTALHEVGMALSERDESSLVETTPGSDGAGVDFDLHSAETLILDNNRPAAKRRRAAGSPGDFDEALHNAPTMILDAHKKWGGNDR